MQVVPDVHRHMTRGVLCGAAALVLGLAGCGQEQPAAPVPGAAGSTTGIERMTYRMTPDGVSGTR